MRVASGAFSSLSSPSSSLTTMQGKLLSMSAGLVLLVVSVSSARLQGHPLGLWEKLRKDFHGLNLAALPRQAVVLKKHLQTGNKRIQKHQGNHLNAPRSRRIS